MDVKKIQEKLKDIKFKIDEIDIVIYHQNCPDGFGSAWVVWRYLKSDATFIGAHPDANIDNKKFKNKNVLFVDISISRDRLDEIIKIAKSVLIIDHHQTFFDELVNHPNTIMFKEHSAIYMTWRIFFPEQKVPHFIKLIEDKDLTTEKHKDTEYFSASLGIKLPFHSLEHFRLWNRLLNINTVNELIDSGKKYHEYKKYLIGRNFHITVPMEFGKHKILVGNFEAVGLTSDLGNALSERSPEYDFVLLWSYHYNENLNSVMLRTRNEGIDLAKIASHYGGGGHPKASRFTWNRSIEELFKEWKTVLPKLMSSKKISKKKMRKSNKSVSVSKNILNSIESN
jgi:oligoribonuclease NrnB/cAMP/cGMP phosphodiesterase (DHH superfamily)